MVDMFRQEIQIEGCKRAVRASDAILSNRKEERFLFDDDRILVGYTRNFTDFLRNFFLDNFVLVLSVGNFFLANFVQVFSVGNFFLGSFSLDFECDYF